MPLTTMYYIITRSGSIIIIIIIIYPRYENECILLYGGQ